MFVAARVRPILVAEGAADTHRVPEYLPALYHNRPANAGLAGWPHSGKCKQIANENAMTY